MKREGRSFKVYYWGVGGSVVFFPEGKYYQKLENIPPSIFVERKLEFLYVELTSTSLS